MRLRAFRSRVKDGSAFRSAEYQLHHRPGGRYRGAVPPGSARETGPFTNLRSVAFAVLPARFPYARSTFLGSPFAVTQPAVEGSPCRP